MIGDPTGAISHNFEVMIRRSGAAWYICDQPEGQIKICEVHDLRDWPISQRAGARKDSRRLSTWPLTTAKFALQAGSPVTRPWAPSLDLVGKI